MDNILSKSENGNFRFATISSEKLKFVGSSVVESVQIFEVIQLIRSKR